MFTSNSIVVLTGTISVMLVLITTEPVHLPVTPLGREPSTVSLPLLHILATQETPVCHCEGDGINVTANRQINTLTDKN